MMNYAVRYASRGGRTEKVARAIADALGVPAQNAAEPLAQRVDILFLGSALYAGEPHSALPAFVQSLSPETVGEVVIFGTSAGKNSPYPKLKELAQAQGLKVSERSFHCPGQFLVLQRGRPNPQDLENVAQFAKSFMGE